MLPHARTRYARVSAGSDRRLARCAGEERAGAVARARSRRRARVHDRLAGSGRGRSRARTRPRARAPGSHRRRPRSERAPRARPERQRGARSGSPARRTGSRGYPFVHCSTAARRGGGIRRHGPRAGRQQARPHLRRRRAQARRRERSRWTASSAAATPSVWPRPRVSTASSPVGGELYARSNAGGSVGVGARADYREARPLGRDGNERPARAAWCCRWRAGSASRT